MAEQVKPKQDFSSTLEDWINVQTWKFAKHWLAWVNAIIGIFVALPFLAPVFMELGFTGLANAIYHAYRVTCHQLPERSFFIFEHQTALCHRCSAIWLAYFVGGLLFVFLRNKLKPLPFHWWILALIPIGLDGGTQFVGPLYQLLPGWILTGLAVMVWLGLVIVMRQRNVSEWQYYLFVTCFPLAMLFVQITGPRLSTWELRTVTGTIFGLASVWLMFPLMNEAFADLRREMQEKLFPSTESIDIA